MTIQTGILSITGTELTQTFNGNCIIVFVSSFNEVTTVTLNSIEYRLPRSKVFIPIGSSLVATIDSSTDVALHYIVV